MFRVWLGAAAALRTLPHDDSLRRDVEFVQLGTGEEVGRPTLSARTARCHPSTGRSPRLREGAGRERGGPAWSGTEARDGG